MIEAGGGVDGAVYVDPPPPQETRKAAAITTLRALATWRANGELLGGDFVLSLRAMGCCFANRRAKSIAGPIL
jgi:hypothetical protein